MSSQSIIDRNIDLIEEENDKLLLDNAQHYMTQKRFALGKKPNMEEAAHALKMLSFICTENCELIDHINKGLAGELEKGCTTNKEDGTCVPYINNTEYLLKCCESANGHLFVCSVDDKVCDPDRLLGWVVVEDTQYTVSSPFEITGGVNTKLTNNAGSILNIVYPVGGLTWWNATTNKFTPDQAGDAYEFTIELKTKALLNDQNFKLELDIGGATGVYWSKTIKLLKGAGEVNAISETITIFTTEEFVTNGGELFVESDSNLEVYDIVFKIERTFRNTH